MKSKIIFVNPNTEEDVDKYLPKILAEAIVNKVAREKNPQAANDANYDMKHPA